MEIQVGELRGDHDRLSVALAAAQRQAQETSEALSAKDQELQEVVDRLQQEEQVIQTLQERFAAMQRHADLLQGELALSVPERAQGASSGTGNMVQLEKVVVKPPAMSTQRNPEGHIVSINPQWRFVVIDLGWDEVKIGDVVSIYHHEQLLAKARVERVQEQICAASLLPEWTASEIQVNDAVRTL